MWPPTMNSRELADLSPTSLQSASATNSVPEAGLQLIMSDISTFITFASAGLFSVKHGLGTIHPNTPYSDQLPPLNAAANTFALSEDSS